MNDVEDKIDRYLSEEMTVEEVTSFETEMENNLELKSQVQDLKSTINAFYQAELNEKLDSIYDEVFVHQESKQKFNYYYISGIAASLLIIIAVTYVFFFNNAPTNSELYMSYFEPMPDLFKTNRGDKENLKEAFKKYSSGKYQEAIKLFGTFPDNYENKERIKFYTAMSFMALNKNNEAIEKLKEISASSVYKQQVQWYLGLAYLKENNAKESIDYLSKIQSNQFKYKEAQEILDSIK